MEPFLSYSELGRHLNLSDLHLHLLLVLDLLSHHLGLSLLHAL